MNKVPLNREVLVSRLAEISKGLKELEKFRRLPLKEFQIGYNFAISEHFLRRTLEAVFDIGSHILSRIPGVRVTTYKEIALSLSKQGIIPQDFVQDKLIKIAGYRNRLVHFYYEIKEQELYQILQDNLEDIEKFCFYIKQVLNEPEKWGLEVE